MQETRVPEREYSFSDGAGDRETTWKRRKGDPDLSSQTKINSKGVRSLHVSERLKQETGGNLKLFGIEA